MAILVFLILTRLKYVYPKFMTAGGVLRKGAFCKLMLRRFRMRLHEGYYDFVAGIDIDENECTIILYYMILMLIPLFANLLF